VKVKLHESTETPIDNRHLLGAQAPAHPLSHAIPTPSPLLCILPGHIVANDMLMVMHGLFNCALANTNLVRRSNHPIVQNVAIHMSLILGHFDAMNSVVPALYGSGRHAVQLLPHV
jgi:hypothetical protein